jgi:hypothetical protein
MTLSQKEQRNSPKMPRGPKGEKRPANVIGNAVHVMRIATGEAQEDFGKMPKRAKGPARAHALGVKRIHSLHRA